MLAAVLVLAGTGRASRWMPLPARRVADAGIAVVVATHIGDLLMLTVTTRWLPEPLSDRQTRRGGPQRRHRMARRRLTVA